MSDKKQYCIIAGWEHIRLGVELEFISRIPVPRGSPKDYPYTFVTQVLNRDTSDMRFKFNDGKGSERFDYERAWTLTPEGTVELDPTLELPGSTFSSHSKPEKKVKIGTS